MMTSPKNSCEHKLPQPGDFARNWMVVGGDIGHPSSSQAPPETYFAVVIYEPGEEIYRLHSQKQENGIVGEAIWHQDLRYNPETGRLESDPDETWLERSICFWQGNAATGRPDCIFAMRRAKIAGIDPAEVEKQLLPWEYRKETGEDGGAILVSSPYGAWGADGG